MPRISRSAKLAELQAALRIHFEDAADFADTTMAPLREQANDYYNGAAFGDEVEGRSQWVQTELRDVVQACLPHLLRVFASKTSRIFEFAPRTPNDIQSAEAQTDYVNYLLQVENDGYALIQTLLRDALVVPGGAVARWGYEADDKIEFESYTGIDISQAAFLRADPEIEVIEEHIRVYLDHDDHDLQAEHFEHLAALAQAGQPLPEPGSLMPSPMDENGERDPTMPQPTMPNGAEVAIDMKVRRTVRGGKIKVSALPPECFLLERRAASLDTAVYACHREIRTVSDLVEAGFDPDVVKSRAGDEDTVALGGLEELSRMPATHLSHAAPPADETMQRVLFCQHFIKFDLDRDGRAEMLRVHTVGRDCLLLDEPEAVSELPFAQFTIDPTPHSALSTSSMFEQVADIQRAKSQMLRDIFDSMAQSVVPRLAVVEGQVNLDDCLNLETGGLIRMKQPGMVQPISMPFLGNDALPLMQYLDDTRAQRTGISRQSQGLDADVLQSTSAIAVAQMTEAASARMEMIARTLAEGGFKRMARGLCRLAKRHQDKPKMLKLREKWVPIDPRGWTADLDVIINTGLGKGDDQKKFQLLTQILGLQQSILQQLGPNNPIVSLSQYRTTLSDLATVGGIPDSSRYFREITPEIEQMLAQQSEKPQTLSDAQAFMQAEQMKVQQKAEIDRLRLLLDAAKAASADDLERDKLDSQNALEAAKIAGQWHTQVDLAKLQGKIDADRHGLDAATDLAKHLMPQPPAAPTAQGTAP